MLRKTGCMPKTLFFIIFSLFVSILSFAQKSITDSVFIINDIEIKTNRLKEFAIGTQIEKIDSKVLTINQTQSLAELLQNHSGLNINNYGPGGVATISSRGGSSSHTAVLWNGINIQSPLNGGVNVSCFPVSLLTDVSIQNGHSGTLFGSGAVTGVVHLSAFGLIANPNYLSVGGGLGSFGNKNASISTKLGNKKLAASFKASTMNVNNNFEYYNIAKFKSPKEKQTNAAQSQFNILQENELKINNNYQVNTSLLYTHNNKDIQTLMTDYEDNTDNEIDNNLFISANLRYVNAINSINYKTGYLFSEMLYNQDNNNSSSVINEIESKFYISDNQLFNIGINATIENGESTGFEDIEQRNRISLFNSYKFKGITGKFNAVASSRVEYVDDTFIPPVFSLGSDYQFNNNLTLKSSFSKNYRLPTFNDLYWIPSEYATGNPDLSPENGWMAEISTEKLFKINSTSINTSLISYYTFLKDAIIWLPGISGIWKPDNLETQKTKGFEFRIKENFKIYSIDFEANTLYIFTHSKILNKDLYNEKPMIYTPKHRIMQSLSVNYKNLGAFFVTNFYSNRYYDYKHYIKEYTIGDLHISYKIGLKNFKSDISLKINNIWNTKYMVMAWYAMPLRNYSISALITIPNKDK